MSNFLWEKRRRRRRSAKRRNVQHGKVVSVFATDNKNQYKIGKK
tara:strand:+ start:318 stop:449 length:132 start_codon:yes stop_codon:yes gene_type:complete